MVVRVQKVGLKIDMASLGWGGTPVPQIIKNFSTRLKYYGSVFCTDADMNFD